MAVRSLFLGGGVFGDAAEHVLYTCPPDMTTIVKYVGLEIAINPPGGFTLIHRNNSGDIVGVPVSTMPWGSDVPIVNPGFLIWECLQPGDTLSVQGDGSWTYTVSCSGAQLDGVAD